MSNTKNIIYDKVICVKCRYNKAELCWKDGLLVCVPCFKDFLAIDKVEKEKLK
jgi:hypothetical protein